MDESTNSNKLHTTTVLVLLLKDLPSHPQMRHNHLLEEVSCPCKKEEEELEKEKKKEMMMLMMMMMNLLHTGLHLISCAKLGIFSPPEKY